MTSRLFPSLAPRLLRVRSGSEEYEEAFELDADGFLDSIVDRLVTGDLTPGSFVAPEMLLGSRCVVLLGPPGSGKSTVFEQLTTELVPSIERIDASGINDVTLQDHLIGPLSSAASGAAVLIVDQLDECPILRRIVRGLRALTDRSRGPVPQLLIGCRAADYPAELTNVLTQIFTNCTIVELAPLTKTAAIELASSLGIDGAALVDQAIAIGAGAFASEPLTLGFLAKIAANGPLPSDAIGVFEQIALQLANEPSSDRTTPNPSTTAAQRVAVARRIAALGGFAGRRTTWKGSPLDTQPTDLPIDECVGGNEGSDANTFMVDAAAVHETLDSALFETRATDRFAFRHSSLGAYLAARFVVEHDTPARQLRSLLFVDTADGRAAIPELLRETAAWIAALDPIHASWIVLTDPASLAPFGRIIRDSDTRANLSAALLDRAQETELGDRLWSRRPWDLDSPSLARQVTAALATTATDWLGRSPARLAIRIAETTRDPEVADALVRHTERTDAPINERALAASVAMSIDPHASGPPLARVLDQLLQDVDAAESDSEDELKGSLLLALWPDHLELEDFIQRLTPPRRRNFLGAYRYFLRTFPARLSDEQVAVALSWIASQLPSGTPNLVEVQPITETDSATYCDIVDESEVPIGNADQELIEAVIDRALSLPTAATHVPAVGTVLAHRFKEDDAEPTLPEALIPDTPYARGLRRDLVLAVLEAEAPDEDGSRLRAYRLVRHWRMPFAIRQHGPARYGLLDGDDVQWVLTSAVAADASGREDVAASLAHVLLHIFNTSRVDHVDIVDRYRASPGAAYVRSWFDPVGIDGPVADTLREHHKMTRSDSESDEVDDLELRMRLAELLDACKANPEQFWRLAMWLRVSPETGRASLQLGDDLFSLPGADLLPTDATELLSAAERYLHQAHDHRAEWLGTSEIAWAAWAGYVAIAALEGQELLEALDAEDWRRWCGAALAVPSASSEEGRSRHKRILAVCASQTPTDLVDALSVLVLGRVARASTAFELEVVDPSWDPTVADGISDLGRTLERLCVGNDTSVLPLLRAEEHSPEPADIRRAATAAWVSLCQRLLDASDIRGEAMLRAALGNAGSEAAVAAGVALFERDSRSAWVDLTTLRSDPVTGKEFALAAADSHQRDAATDGLTEQQLGELYQWLSGLYSPESDPSYDGVHAVGREEQARQWRDRVLGVLARVGTAEAVEQLLNLAQHFPTRMAIQANLVTARQSITANRWNAPSPAEVSQLLADSRRRLVRSEAELAEVVVEVLNEINHDLATHADLLWDCSLTRTEQGALVELWRPKPEAALSNYLGHELQLRLGGRGITVNREVLVHPTTAYGAGDQPDILIDARPRPSDLGSVAVAVAIEVKGSWHPDLHRAQRDQLAARYVPHTGETGIYVVGWFDVGQWDDRVDPRLRTARRQLRQMTTKLEAQAVEIRRDLGVRTTPTFVHPQRPGN